MEDRTGKKKAKLDVSGEGAWLNAHHDPVASLYTFSTCLDLEDLDLDGDYKLLVGDLGSGQHDIKLKIYNGTQLSHETPLLDLPTAVKTFMMDAREPAVAIASGSNIFIYKTIKPYFKFMLPLLEVNSKERQLWEQVKECEIDPTQLRDGLDTLSIGGCNPPLTVLSLTFLQLEAEDLLSFVDAFKLVPLTRQSVVTCMATLYKSYSDDKTASCLVIGTENSDIYILDPAAFTFLSKMHLPAVPVFLSVTGVYDVDFQIIVACRDGCIYTVKKDASPNRQTLPRISLSSQPCGMIGDEKNIIVGTMNQTLACYSNKGKLLWNVSLPDSITAMERMDYCMRNFKAVIVALANCEVRIYKEKYLVNSFKMDDIVVGIKFGQFGREEGALILVSQGGALTVKILKRGVVFEAKETTSSPQLSQFAKLDVPKKTKVYVDQTVREREHAILMHQTFQQHLLQLKLEAARMYQAAVSSSLAPVTSSTECSLNISAQVQGIGPIFKVTILLQNTSPKSSIIDHYLLFQCDESLYNISTKYIKLPMLVPGLSYSFSTMVECLNDLGLTDVIKVRVHCHGNPISLLTAVIDMPAIRVQSRDGTKRITVQPYDTLRILLQQVQQVFNLNDSQIIHMYRSPGYKNGLTSVHIDMKLSSIPVQHGDMLYMFVENKGEGVVLEGATGGRNDVKMLEVVEDEIDRLLRKKDGKIYRKRDPQLCHHGPQGKCLNCAPLEPWDSKYLESRDPPIKHMSFHCYLRKLTSGVDKGKFVNLEDLSCKVKSHCLDHPPWPEGICTKCQPSAVTLARQPYRHVDNIMFEDKAIVNRFIEGWRKSCVQRLGYLYGRYEEYDEVPLGIKAVVVTIYEPPQACTKYSIELLEDPRSKLVNEMARHLGLRKVGWIFTDLEPEQDGKVSYKRNINTHLLTAEECIMAADYQNANPSPCKQASNRYFGSKFVTVCISGNELNQVDTKGYQVSNQCTALVRDNCLIPTLDAPELGYIRESSNEQYVPDVFYKCKGDYGMEVTKLARPLPLEYLIVELTTTTPLRPKPSLPGGRGAPFPVENRETIGESQTFEAFVKYLDQQQGVNFLCAMSDFHFLLYLYTTDVVHLQPHLPELCQAIQRQDREGAENWKKREYWQHIEQLIMASIPSPVGDGTQPIFPLTSSLADSNDVWRCQYCTLDNSVHETTCNACGLPRN